MTHSRPGFWGVKNLYLKDTKKLKIPQKYFSPHFLRIFWKHPLILRPPLTLRVPLLKTKITFLMKPAHFCLFNFNLYSRDGIPGLTFDSRGFPGRERATGFTPDSNPGKNFHSRLVPFPAPAALGPGVIELSEFSTLLLKFEYN